MPHSPFTRFLAVVLVALYGLALLWPDDRAHIWGWYAMAALPIILGVFTWSAVRSAAPFDDRAFHRCLPPSDSHTFFRVLWIHLLVLAGIALVVLVYCGIWNFSWRAASYGIAMLTLPVWAFVSAVGLACSAASSTQHWRSTSWIAILATPVFSAAILYEARQGFGLPDKNPVYFPPIRTVVLTAASLYPLIWWLAAARKRRILALSLGAATGALLPWLYVYGDFIKVRNPQPMPSRTVMIAAGEVPAPPVSAADAPVKISRKPFPQTQERWIPVEDLLNVEGLEEGQILGVGWGGWGIRHDSSQSREFVPIFEVREKLAPQKRGVRYSEAFATKSGGKIVWAQAR